MRLSVVVPAFNRLADLTRCVEAVRASDLPEDEWELVIVDDGSADSSGWAETLGATVLRVSDGPRGPAAARNMGAERSHADVLVFIDQDVCVAPDALSRFASAFEDAERGGVFGTYDDSPDDPGFFSQYRNLYHRFVHLRGAGPAETFWAGCGAVRRSAFEGCGGFDSMRYPRPQIEDIELGYRLRSGGWTIELDPSIECTHLKRWTLVSMVRTDLVDRGIPWMRLLLEGRRPAALNVGYGERLRTMLGGVAILGGVGSLLLTSLTPLLLGIAAALCLLVANGKVFVWFAERRGVAFAFGAVLANLLYYATAFVAGVCGLIVHLASPSSSAVADTGQSPDVGRETRLS